MYSTPDYPDYNQPPRPPQPPQKRQGGAGLWVAVIVVSLLVSGVGTWAMNRYMYGDGRTLVSSAPEAENAPVTLQTVASSPRTDDGQQVAGGTQIERVAAIGKASVVEITTEARVTHPYWGSYVTGGAGSGVIISEDGYIVTNEHVIAGSDSICVRMPEGQLYEATLIGSDVQTDLAVIRIAENGLTPAVFADSDAVVVGELAVAIGNPLGTLGGTVTEGIISARDREIIIGGEAMVLLQTSAAISPGNSGGGLFDQDGHIVGIVNAKSGEENVEGIGFAIPANTALSIASQLIEHGYVGGRPLLGVEATTVASYDAFYRYNATRPGVYVTNAVRGSDLVRGDRIIAVEGTQVTSVSEVKTAIGQFEVGDSVSLQVVRSGRETTVDVVLMERSADVPDTMI